MIAYLLQSSLCLSIMYLFYMLVFSRSTLFHANRLYLVTALILSFIIPALKFSIPEVASHDSYSILQPVRDAVNISHYDATDTRSARAFSALPGWNAIACGAYIVVLVFLTLRRVRSIWSLLRISRRELERTPDGYRIVRTNFLFPFSFGNIIYLPSQMNDPMVLEHEKCHIKQAHWVDLLLVEIAVLVMWFNPAIYFFRSSLKSVHEYHADAHAVAACGNLPAYLSCLLQQVRIHQSGLISPFFSNSLKQRINMMTKNQTPRIFSTIYLLTVPVIVVLLAAFSFRKDGSTDKTVDVGVKRTLKVVIDPAHGGEDHGATAADGTYEKEITLSVATEIEKAARAAGIQVTLTRESDVGLTLAQRIAIAKTTRADAFISIHADNNPGDPDKGGARIMVSSTKPGEANQHLATCLINGMKEVSDLAADMERGDPYVLKNNPVAAVIIEVGFLSNKQDLTRLSDPAQQQTLAQSIVKGLLRYGVE